MTAPRTRMSGAELQTAREYLGLTIESLAGMLNVIPRTVRAWESGADPIPYRVPDEVAVIENYSAHAVDELVAALRADPDPFIVTYRRDGDMHTARPDTAHLPARWWRHIVARAVHEVPGVRIVGDTADVHARKPKKVSAK